MSEYLYEDEDLELTFEVPVIFGREDLTGFYSLLDEDGNQIEVDDD